MVVEPLDGGMTIAEIIAAYEQIEGQEVSLRARVTKFSANILEKNWITLQDGTGTAPNDKITATTMETVKTGEVFTIEGIVKTDVNLGGGYLYKVLLEEARFTQE